jgi:hypothetical protein
MNSDQRSNNNMKRIVFFVIFLFFLIFSYTLTINTLNKKQFISKTPQESIKNDMFLSYYYPDKDTVYIDSIAVKTEIIWAEKNWSNKINFFNRDTVVESGMRVYFDYPEIINNGTRLDFMTTDTVRGGYMGEACYNGEIYMLAHSITDTIIINFVQFNYNSGEFQKVDSLVYVASKTKMKRK